MSDDTFAETSSQSIFGRLGDAIKGVLFGIIVIPFCIVLLFWNEGRAVKTAASLKEGVAVVVSVAADAVQPSNEGKLVHVSGEATTVDIVRDPMFAVSQNAIRLTRTVEMFQWKEEAKSETAKKLGGGTETKTTYNYNKTWADKLIPSSGFKLAAEHTNPAAMMAETLVTVAGKVTLGKFNLPPDIIGKMQGDQTLVLTDAEVAKLPAELKAKVKCVGEAFYVGADPVTPAIGDQRVKFTVLKPATFSILARQSGQTLDVYQTKAGRVIERVESGNVPAAAMFQHAASENKMLTWGLRIGGMLVMALGIGLILRPLSTLADVVPLLGDMIGVGTAFAALVVAAVTSTVIIAVAWFAVRPILSVVLIAVAIGVVVLGKKIAGRKTA